MHFDHHDRLGIIIDGANTHAASKVLGFDIDYKRLLQFARDRGRLVRAEYYTAVLDDADSEYSSIRPLVDWLDYNGFAVKTVPGKNISDIPGRRVVRSSNNIEITLGMVRMARNVDHVLLFSGHGEFRSPVAFVQSEGVKVSVISTLKTAQPFIADEVRRQADQFIELDDLKEHIGRAADARTPRLVRRAAE